MMLPKRNSATPSTACNAVGDSVLGTIGSEKHKYVNRKGRTGGDDGGGGSDGSCRNLVLCSSSRTRDAPQSRANWTSLGGMEEAWRRKGQDPGIGGEKSETCG